MAPITPPMAMSGNTVRLPQLESRKTQQKVCQTLLQGRERGRDNQHILLLQQSTRRRARRPDALGNCLGADAEALSGVLVGPDVTPLVEAAQLRIPGTDHG